MQRELETELSSLLSEILGEKIDSVQPIDKPGEVNKVLRIGTAKRELIVRINDPEELQRFRKEQWCAHQAGHKGVATPEVLAVDRNEHFSYMLLSYIQGKRADDDSVDKPQIWRKVGRYASFIHAIKVKGFGESLDDITSGSTKQWSEYLNKNIAALNANSQIVRIANLNEVHVENMRKWFEKLQAIDLKFGLSHGDLSLDNVVLDKKGKVYLLDWGSAEAHIVPHYDFGVIIEDSIADTSQDFQEFLQGYGMSHQDYLAIKPEIISIMSLISLDKLRWAMDKKPDKIDFFVRQLKQHYNKQETL